MYSTSLLVNCWPLRETEIVVVLGSVTNGVLMVILSAVQEMGSTSRCPSLMTLLHTAYYVKPEPWTVTVVPPRIGPNAGDTEDTLGSR